MSSTIVCGVDRSEGSDRAAGVAARLADALDCEVMLVHVQASPRLFERLTGSQGGRRGTLRWMRALVARHGLPPATALHVTAGDPADELMRFAADEDAQLLVAGSRGLLELGSALLGDVASALMASAPCPVVVVPPDTPAPADLSTVVCGVEGSERDADVLRFGADLVGRLGGSLHAVHAFHARALAVTTAPYAPPVPELRDAAQDTMARALVAAGVRAHGHVLSLGPVAALTRVAEEERAGLIILGSHGHGKLGSVLLGSVTIEVIAEAHAPVVVLPRQAEVAAGSGHYEIAASPR